MFQRNHAENRKPYQGLKIRSNSTTSYRNTYSVSQSHGNPILSNKDQKGPKNARYTHHGYHSELRTSAELTYFEKIISNEVEKPRYFVLLADERI